MIWLQYALWRRDIAARKLAKQRKLGESRVLWPRDARRMEKLMMRVDRWERIADVAEHRLLNASVNHDEK